MYDSSFQQLGLSSLLEQDLTSYEYFNALPLDIQKKVKERDVASFDEMKDSVSQLRRMR